MSLRGKKDKDKKDKNAKEEPKKVEPTGGSPTQASATRNWKKRLDENTETNRYNTLNSMIYFNFNLFNTPIFFKKLLDSNLFFSVARALLKIIISPFFRFISSIYLLID